MTAEMRLFLDGEGADAETIALFREVRVEQAIGLATEAELELDLALDEQGEWQDLDRDFAQAFRRVRVEVAVRGGDFVALVDGPVVGQRARLSARPDQSVLTLVVQDDSVLLNREERVDVFEDQTASDIARALFAEAGLAAEVDDVPAAGGRLARFNVRRGTAMSLLRELGRRHGMFVHVRPGDAPGASTGVFQRPRLTPGNLPELLVIGAERNVDELRVAWDALKPVRVAAASVDEADIAVLSAEAETASDEAMGDTASHQATEPGRLLMSRTRERQADLDAGTQAVLDHSAFAWTAEGETRSDLYPAVLSPHVAVNVAGAGHMSGAWLVSRVSHVLTDEGYTQGFGLRRNARLAGGGGGGPSVPGVF